MQQRANAPWKSPCATVLPPGNPQTLYSLTLEASDDPEHTKQ